MKYGCIAARLTHSFSRLIHERIGDYDYELREVAPDALDDFMRRRDFCAVNVTIPYKRAVLPYLAGMDEAARAVGAVNTVVNRGGELYGYNTDVYGMEAQLSHMGLPLRGENVMILGTGGTSATAAAVAERAGARQIVTVSRTPHAGVIGYAEARERVADAQVIINATPCGMFPDDADMPPVFSTGSRPVGVLDAVYHPLSSMLVLEARARGAVAQGGLYMLVAQAVRASEIFFGEVAGTREERIGDIFREVLAERRNIVLTGMPGCGKSTVGRLLAARTGREFYDTDRMVTDAAGTTIPDIFATAGEAAFRALEREAIEKASRVTHAVIATGGGAVLDGRNVTALRRNGWLYFLDCPPGALPVLPDRPLAKCRAELEARYAERYATYTATSDAVISMGDPSRVREAADEIERSHRSGWSGRNE